MTTRSLRTSFLLLASALFGLTSVSPAISADPPVAAVTVEIGPWAGDRCFSKVSPELKLSGLPNNAAQARVFLTDLYVPSFDHGGGKLALTSSGPGQAVIPAGAVPNYKGPCSQQDRSSPIHDYEFSVVVFDAGGATIGRGKAANLFDPSNEAGRYAAKRK